jgi:hypothetical protein
MAGCNKNPAGPTPIVPASIQVSGTAPPVGVTSQFIATAIAGDGAIVSARRGVFRSLRSPP